MGFERQRGSERGLGRAAKRGGNAVGIVGMVLKMSLSVCGEWPERRWRGGGHTSAPACGSTSPGRRQAILNSLVLLGSNLHAMHTTRPILT